MCEMNMVEEDREKCGTCNTRSSRKQNHRNNAKNFWNFSKIKQNNVEDKPLPPSFVCSAIYGPIFLHFSLLHFSF